MGLRLSGGIAPRYPIDDGYMLLGWTHKKEAVSEPGVVSFGIWGCLVHSSLKCYELYDSAPFSSSKQKLGIQGSKGTCFSNIPLSLAPDRVDAVQAYS